jgi:hypothetical protein
MGNHRAEIQVMQATKVSLLGAKASTEEWAMGLEWRVNGNV